MSPTFRSSFAFLRSAAFWLLWSLTFVGILFLEYRFSDFELTMNNLGRWVALLEFALNGIFLLVAPIFFGLSGYKIVYFSQIGRSTSGGIIGSLLSVLVTGCPACSITLASYIGLGSVLSVFPYFGYEIRVLGIAILLYATYRVYHSLETCEFRQISTK